MYACVYVIGCAGGKGGGFTVSPIGFGAALPPPLPHAHHGEGGNGEDGDGIGMGLGVKGVWWMREVESLRA